MIEVGFFESSETPPDGNVKNCFAINRSLFFLNLHVSVSISIHGNPADESIYEYETVAAQN